ncbi:MAG: phage integrase SAM-like domain-containing protein [Flavobacteriales bacterium]|nr:phage integrase SAM-like domain-containing protein [Flavobacteriales bacterium]MCB9363172.1 phage integrase SAM-like domain-containing protein [Flavobacteriales bacterium]
MFSLKIIRRNQKIYVIYYLAGKKAYFPTGVHIEDRFWDSKHNQIKKSFNSYSEVNAIINQVFTKVEQLVIKRQALGEDIEASTIRELITSNKPSRISLFEFIDNSIAERLAINKTAKAANLLKVKNKLLEYQKANKVRIDFKNIDIDFYFGFYKYFVDNGYSDNYFGSIIQNLKTLLHDAIRRKVTTYEGFKHPGFKVIEIETDAVYLSEDELEVLYNLNLERVLDNCRKAFIIGAFCGLRYSDLKLINETSFATGVLRYRQQKTSKLVHVPLHPYVTQYLKDGLPNVLDLSDFNKNIKEVCRAANINDKVNIVKRIGGKRIETTFEKWQLVSSHSMRRSFATNLHIRGSPSKIIMELTGHTTLKSFEKYLRCTIKEDRSKPLKLWK